MSTRFLSHLFSLVSRFDFQPGGSPLPSPASAEPLPQRDEDWSALFRASPRCYSNALARIAARLSEAAETGDGADVTAVYRACGFARIAVGNYRHNTGTAPDIGSGRVSLAFAAGHRTILREGRPVPLLVLTVRGTVNLWELYRDLTTQPANGLHDLPIYDLVREFETELLAGLRRYLSLQRELAGQPMVFLLTGHSLGGAAANLLAARLTAHAPQWLNREAVYCYTFGSLDTFDPAGLPAAPIVSGYENLHTLYNEQDDFGPIGHGLCGVPLLMAKGCGRAGKFGLLHTFEADYRKTRKSSSPNHDMCVYLAALGQPELVSRWERECL